MVRQQTVQNGLHATGFSGRFQGTDQIGFFVDGLLIRSQGFRGDSAAQQIAGAGEKCIGGKQFQIDQQLAPIVLLQQTAALRLAIQTFERFEMVVFRNQCFLPQLFQRRQQIGHRPSGASGRAPDRQVILPMVKNPDPGRAVQYLTLHDDRLSRADRLKPGF